MSTEPKSTLPFSPPFFYGWVIVATASFTLLITFGTRLSFTVFFVALIEDFGWTRADTSVIFSLNMVVFALTSTLAGMALDRWGARPVFGTGAAILALGLFLSSRIESLAGLAFSYGVVAGLGITILGLGPQAGLISRWFWRRRGLALGLTFAGTGLGTLVLTPGSEYLISHFGWRTAYRVFGALALLMIPLIVTFLRLWPAQVGLEPDGEKPALFPDNAASDDRPDPAARRGDWTMHRAIRTPAFWLVIAASVGAIGPLRMLTVHQLAAAVDAGIDRLYAATVIGFSGAVTAISFILFGLLSDRTGRRAAYLLGSICLLGAIGLLGNLEALGGRSWLPVYALVLGLGEGSRASLVTAVASDLFPGPALGAINGAVGAGFALGAAILPWLAGYLYDVSGTYRDAFLIAASAIVISALALWLAPAVHGAAEGQGVKAPG